MEYAKLSNTDIEVSKLCVGCITFEVPSVVFMALLLPDDKKRNNGKT